ncbi:MAG: hypothetical protein ACJ72U_17645 [Nitrososphaeraceae archaeon]
MSKKNALLEESNSITCNLCNERFESLGDMQRHVVTQHFQKGDIPTKKGKQKKRQ